MLFENCKFNNQNVVKKNKQTNKHKNLNIFFLIVFFLKGHENECNERWMKHTGIEPITSWKQIDELRKQKFNEMIVQSIKAYFPTDISNVILDFLVPSLLTRCWIPKTIKKKGNLWDSKYGGMLILFFCFFFLWFVFQLLA